MITQHNYPAFKKAYLEAVKAGRDAKFVLAAPQLGRQVAAAVVGV